MQKQTLKLSLCSATAEKVFVMLFCLLHIDFCEYIGNHTAQGNIHKQTDQPISHLLSLTNVPQHSKASKIYYIIPQEAYVQVALFDPK